MFNNQFRPPMFPNTFGNMGTVANFNQFGQGMQAFGGMQPMGPPIPFGYGNQGGNSSPANASDIISQSVIDGSSPANGSVRRLQQVQHHVQQVPVVRTVQMRERIIEIPQIHVVKEYVPKIEVVERVKEVPKIEIQVVEKVIEVPQIQIVDKYVDKVEVREVERYVPKIEIVEIVREVPKVEYEIVERIVEVPQIQYVDRIVEVPQKREVLKHVAKLEIVDVPIKREVKVPKPEKKIVEEVLEVTVPEIIEVPIEKEIKVTVPVPQIQRIERPVPGPLNVVDVEVEVKVPRHVQVPQYIDVPVPRDVVKEVLVPRQVPKYKDVEVPVEVEQIVTIPIERKVPVPRTVYKHVEEIKRVEVPYEVTISEEVEEIVEIVQQVQPVIEPVVQTRYERLPPIREKGKPVYVNGGPSGPAGNNQLPPLPPNRFNQNMNQFQGHQQNQFQSQIQFQQNQGPRLLQGPPASSFANQATPIMNSATAPSFFQEPPVSSYFNEPQNLISAFPTQQPQIPAAAVSSPLATALNLANSVSLRPSQARPDSPLPASPIKQDITDLGHEDPEDEADRNSLTHPEGRSLLSPQVEVHIQSLPFSNDENEDHNVEQEESNINEKSITGIKEQQPREVEL